MGKGEIALTSSFSFSHSVFKRLVSQGCLKVSLCGNGLTHYQTTNFRLFQTERVCRQQTERVCRPVENTVGKGEIARHEQFLLFPQCFQKACFPGVSKGVILWEWVQLFTKQQHYSVVQIESLLFQGW